LTTKNGVPLQPGSLAIETQVDGYRFVFTAPKVNLMPKQIWFGTVNLVQKQIWLNLMQNQIWFQGELDAETD